MQRITAPWLVPVLALLALAAPARALRVVGTVPEEPDPPVLLVPVPDPVVVLDLRRSPLRSLAGLKDGAGAFGMGAAFALEQRRAALGAAVGSADVAALAEGLDAALGERLRAAQARFRAAAFGDKDPAALLFLFRPLKAALETRGQGAGDRTGSDAAPLAVPLEVRAHDRSMLRVFVAAVLADAEVRAAAEAAAWDAQPPVPSPGPGGALDYSGLEGPGGGGSAPLDGEEAARSAGDALTEDLWRAVTTGNAPGRAALQLLASLDGAGGVSLTRVASLRGPARAWARAALEGLIDAQRAAAAAVLATPTEPVVAVVDLNRADAETLRRAGVPEEGIRELLARRGRIESLSAVRGLVGEEALRRSDEFGASLAQIQAPDLARRVLDTVDDRDPFERQAAPLTAAQLQERLGDLGSRQALTGPGESFFVTVPELPYPVLVRVQGGRVVGMGPAPRLADGTSVAVAPDGTEVERRGPVDLHFGRFLPLEPMGDGMYRVVPEGDPQREALVAAFQIPYLDRDLELLSLHRRGLLSRPPPSGGVSDAVRQPILQGSLLVVLKEERSIHSAAGAMRVRNPDGAVVPLEWAPRVVVPLAKASLFAAQRDGDLPMLLTHELAHVAMFDVWHGRRDRYRLQGRNHGVRDDRYLSGRMNAMVEGWAEAWAILMSRDPEIARAFASTQRFLDHRGWDAGEGAGWVGERALDGHSLLAHEYVAANAFADTMATREWSAVGDGRELLESLPRGSRLEDGDGGRVRVVGPDGAALMELMPRDVARLRGLRAFDPPPEDILGWIQNALRRSPERGKRAGAELLASARYQPIAEVGHGAIGQGVDREPRGRQKEHYTQAVLAGRIPAAGPWPRVGPELYVRVNRRGLPATHQDIDLNRYDDPSYGRVLGLSGGELQQFVAMRERGPPFSSFAQARDALPARLRRMLDAGRRAYLEHWRPGR